LLNNPHVKIVVAEINDILSSTCQLSLCSTLTNNARPFGIIEHVITSSKYRRSGLSQKVIEKSLEFAWEFNCYKVMLLSGENCAAAHNLYEKIGFSQVLKGARRCFSSYALRMS